MLKSVKPYLKPDMPKNEVDHSYLVVPDLHGTYSLYRKVEKFIKNETLPSRRIIFLGDYMDRGERATIGNLSFKDAGSYLVMRDLIKLQAWAKERGQALIFLRGNHEIFFEDFYIHDNKYAYEKYDFFKNSVDCLSYFFKKDKEFYEAFILFLKNLQPYYFDEKYHYLFVHAGIDPQGGDFQKQVDEGIIYWVRDQFLFSEKKLKYKVIFGHTPFSKPFLREDKIGLDSGVYKRGFINLLKIDDEKQEIIKVLKPS